MSAYQRCSGLLWVATAALACGSAQLNQSKLNETQSAIQGAERLGAEQDPKAKEHLQLARDEAERAKRSAADGDAQKGDLLLERSRADAQLAAQLMRTRTEEDKIRQIQMKAAELGGSGAQPAQPAPGQSVPGQAAPGQGEPGQGEPTRGQPGPSGPEQDEPGPSAP